MRRVRERSVVLAVTVVLGACAGSPFAADAPIPTLPEAEPPTVPTLDATPSVASGPLPTPGQPSQPTATPPPPDPTPPPTPAPPVAPTEEQDPVALGRSLGVAGMVELLAEDPALAGPRGPDLLADLQRIAERGDRPDRRRIEELRGRLPGWVEDQELDPRIATATDAALVLALEQAPAQGGDDDNNGGGDDDD